MEYHCEGPALLDQIIIGGKTWVHYHILKFKKASMARDEPRKIGWQVNGHRLSDSQGVLLTHYVPKGVNVNSVHYCKVRIGTYCTLSRAQLYFGPCYWQ